MPTQLLVGPKAPSGKNTIVRPSATSSTLALARRTLGKWPERTCRARVARCRFDRVPGTSRDRCPAGRRLTGRPSPGSRGGTLTCDRDPRPGARHRELDRPRGPGPPARGADPRDQVDVMLAITRGGMVPAGMLAYRLGIRNILVAAVEYYDDHGKPGPSPTFFQFPADPLLRGQRVLIVDEVWDSGTTIVAVADRVRQAGGDPPRRSSTTSRSAPRSTRSPTSTRPPPTPGSSTRSSSGTDDSPGPPGVGGAADGQPAPDPLWCFATNAAACARRSRFSFERIELT